MTLRRRCSVAAVLAATTATAARADDLQMWTAAGVSLVPVEHLELNVEPQLRFDEDVSRVSAVLLDSGLQYRIARWLRVGAGYRAEYERAGSGDFELRHRLNADIGVRADLDRTRMVYRLRLQEEVRPSSNDGYRATLRNLFGVSYRGWKRWTPGLSIEPYLALGDFDDMQLDKVRLTVGTTYDITKRQELEIFYRIELPTDSSMAGVRHILGLTYHYDLDLE